MCGGGRRRFPLSRGLLCSIPCTAGQPRAVLSAQGMELGLMPLLHISDRTEAAGLPALSLECWMLSFWAKAAGLCFWLPTGFQLFTEVCWEALASRNRR